MKEARFSREFWQMVYFWLVTMAALFALIWYQHSHRIQQSEGIPVSENLKPIIDNAVQGHTQSALNAFGQELIRSFTQPDGAGNQRLSIPLAQMACDLAVTQLKLEAIFEELGTEQLVDPAKLTARLVQKLERETNALKQHNDARPKVQAVSGAIAAAINGSGRKG